MKSIGSGQILAKLNGDSFGRNEKAKPFIQVKKAVKYNKHEYLVNGKYRISVNNVKSILPTEAEELLIKWENCDVSPTIKNTLSSHIREDNGQPKESLDEYRVQRVLFAMRNRHPEKNLEAYICSTCGKIHIGRNDN